MITTRERFDPKDAEQLARSRLISEIMIERLCSTDRVNPRNVVAALSLTGKV